MGRVKELLPEGWTEPGYGQEPDEAELLAMDAAQAIDRYISSGDPAMWNTLALASDKLSHFLETHRPKRIA